MGMIGQDHACHDLERSPFSDIAIGAAKVFDILVTREERLSFVGDEGEEIGPAGDVQATV